MSTFAVFGMTLDVAMAEARKTVKTTRPDAKRPGHKIELSVEDWLLKAAQTALRCTAVRRNFINLARKGSKCRDMRIKAKRTLVDAQVQPIINPKKKAPKFGYTD